jgi:hypothetical protein
MTAPRHSKIKSPDTSSAGLLHSGFFKINQLQKVSKMTLVLTPKTRRTKEQ